MLGIPEKWSVTAALLVPMLLAAPALAQDKLRIGKSVPNSWAFAATDVGVRVVLPGSSTRTRRSISCTIPRPTRW